MHDLHDDATQLGYAIIRAAEGLGAFHRAKEKDQTPTPHTGNNNGKGRYSTGTDESRIVQRSLPLAIPPLWLWNQSSALLSSASASSLLLPIVGVAGLLA